jgi:outer membrane receptor protein involved in Fe transport
VTYQGARFAARYVVNNDWDVLVTEALQNMDAEGSFAEYPTGSDFQPLQPLQTTTFEPSWDKDNWENTAWTLNGKVGPLKAVYTGGYMIRHISQQQDYSNYSRTAAGMYYECTGGGTGWGGPEQCYSPVTYWRDEVRNTHFSNEFRVSTPENWRLRGIGGLYYEEYKIYDNMNFDYKTIPSCSPTNLSAALAGGLPCVANVSTAPNSTANQPGARGDTTAFGEDTQRGYNQEAAFVSADLDILSNLTITLGTRYYQYNEYEKGSQYGTGTGCLDIPNGACVASVNIDSHNDKITYHGFKSKAGVTWRPNSLTTVYYTYSQGFRPGAFNRSTGNVADLIKGAEPQFDKPNGYAPDSLTNNEVGVKTDLFDHRLRVNLSAYYMQWDGVQFAFFNPTELGNTTFLTNGPTYDVKGAEFQIVGKPMDGLTLQATGSYNDDYQANSPCLQDNVAGSAAFGHCITSIYNKSLGATVPFVNPFGTKGSVPAFSPKWQATVRARYDWTLGPYAAFATADANYTGKMFNEPATYTPGSTFPNNIIPSTTLLRYEMPGYVTADASIGIRKDHWGATFFCNNLADSHASTYTSSAQFIESKVPLRPRVYGLKLDFDY